MKILITALSGLALLFAIGCRSSAADAVVPAPEASTALPEIRYYMIADT